MRLTKILAVLGVFVLCGAFPAQAVTPEQCKALFGTDFGQIPEAPSHVTSAAVVAADGTRPSFCQVEGFVTPQVGFELHMPLDGWNGKFLFQGCGAMCGSMMGIQGCAEAVTRGYTCATTDMGHKGLPYDGKWAYNNPTAERDFGHRATHVATVAGKAIADAFYGNAPQTSYFRGCSTGGRQALVAAQRYPTDFDGIIAGAPALYTKLGPPLQLFWGAQNSIRPDGSRVMDPAKLSLVYAAAVAACDADDGVEDGVISDPVGCDFDPSELQCRRRGGDDCLTADELDLVQKLYRGAQPENGLPILANAQLPGSEMGWSGYVTGGNYNFGSEILRYLVFAIDPGPDYTVADFDWEVDPQRMDLSLITAGNPNLGPFRDAGGKLILFQGMADAAIIGTGTRAYFEMVEGTMGGRDATSDFARYYEFAGMDHCRGGAGLNHADMLSSLEAWVEGGRAPEAIIGYNMKLKSGEGPVVPPQTLDPSAAAFSRPVYPYPDTAEFTGGDWKDAGNYRRKQNP